MGLRQSSLPVSCWPARRVVARVGTLLVLLAGSLAHAGAPAPGPNQDAPAAHAGSAPFTAPSNLSMAESLSVHARDGRDFGATALGTSSPAQRFVVSNHRAQAPMRGLSIVFEGEGFRRVGGSCRGMLPAGQDCSVLVAFEPARAGVNTGALVVRAQGVRTELVLTLEGEGLVTPGAFERFTSRHGARSWRLRGRLYATSCEEYARAARANGQAPEDGVYTVVNEAFGTTEPVDLWCDMRRDGGGWTLVARAQAGQIAGWAKRSELSSGTGANLAGETFKYDDEVVNALARSRYRIELADGTMRFVDARCHYNHTRTAREACTVTWANVALDAGAQRGDTRWWNHQGIADYNSRTDTGFIVTADGNLVAKRGWMVGFGAGPMRDGYLPGASFRMWVR